MSSIARLFGSSKFWLAVILLLAAFLRFYRLGDYLQFLGDEGRDVLVVKRMIVDGKWTLLGPTASVGGFYTGPIYYYFMLPFLWLFRLDPVGPAVMAALFGLATIVLIFLFTKVFFGEKAALSAAFFVAVSPKMVDISRFSWNPNPIPFFALGTMFCLYLASTKHRLVWSFFSGISLGILYQLHYMDLIFLPIVGLVTLLIFPVRLWIIQGVTITAGFLLGNSLFLIFELRHNFPNTRSVWEFITRHGATVAPRSNNYAWLFNDITRQLFEITIGFRGAFLNVFYQLSLLAFAFWSVVNVKTSKTKIIILCAWLFVGVFGVGSYRGTLYDHYFNLLYPLPFLFLGLGTSFLFRRKILWPVGIFAILALLYFQIPKLYIWQPPNKLVEQTKQVAREALEIADNQPYNFALIAPGNSDHAYRYFLEIWGQIPAVILNEELDPKRQTVTNQLIVVCEQKDCQPLGHPLWEIAGFGRAEIATKKPGPAGITLFKLVHYKGK